MAVDSATESATVYRSAPAAGALPLVGHSPAFIRDPLRFLTSQYRYGDLIELRLGPERAFLPLHPDLVRQVLRNPQVFDKGGALFEFARTSGRNDLVTCGWPDHQRLRPMLQPLFRQRHIVEYSEVMREEIERLDRGWRTGEEIDVAAQTVVLTSRVAARTMFGADLDEGLLRRIDQTLDSLISDSFKAMMQGAFLYTALPRSLATRAPFPAKYRWRRANARFDALTDAVIEEYRHAPEGRTGMLALLHSVRDEQTGAPLEYREIRDSVLTMLVAGTETTATTLAWAFHVLSEHPDVEERLHAEVDEVLDGRCAQYADLPRLRYTARVISETLRLYPAGWLSARTTTEPAPLGGRLIPKGATILVSPYAVHRNPANFPDPERFDPDRWLPERAAETAAGAFIPFMSGHRKCIGDTFALTEAALALATLTARWSLRARPGRRGAKRPVLHTVLGTGKLPLTPTPR
jgi:cytochrome P450